MRNTHEDLALSKPNPKPLLQSPPPLLGLPNLDSGHCDVNLPQRGFVVLCLSASRLTNAVNHSRCSRLQLLSNSAAPAGPTALGRPQAAASSSKLPIVGITMSGASASLSPSLSSSEHPLTVYTPHIILEERGKACVATTKKHTSHSPRKRSPFTAAAKRTDFVTANGSLSTTQSLAIQICKGLRGEVSQPLDASASANSMAEGRGGEIITINMGASNTGKTHFLLGSAFPFFEHEDGSGAYHQLTSNESLLASVMRMLFSAGSQPLEDSSVGQKCHVEVAVSVIELNDAAPFSPVSAEYHPTEAVDLLSGKRDVYAPGSDPVFEVGSFIRSNKKSNLEDAKGIGSSPTGCFMENWTDIPAARYVSCSSAAEVQRVIGVALSRSLSWHPVRVDGKIPQTRMENREVREGGGKGDVDGDNGAWFLRPKDRKEHGHLLLTFLVRQRTDVWEDKVRVGTLQPNPTKGRLAVGVWRLWDLSGPVPDNGVIETSSSFPSSCSDTFIRTFAGYTHHTLSRWALGLGRVFSGLQQDAKNKVDVHNPSVCMIQACMEGSCSMCIFIASLRQDACFDKLNEDVLRSAAAWQAWAMPSHEVLDISRETASQCASRREENLHAARRVLKKFAVSAHTYLYQIAMLPLSTKRDLKGHHLTSDSVFTCDLSAGTSRGEKDPEEGGFMPTDMVCKFQREKKESPRAAPTLCIKVACPNTATTPNTSVESASRYLKSLSTAVEEARYLPKKQQPDTVQPFSPFSPTSLSHTELLSATEKDQSKQQLDYHGGTAKGMDNKLDMVAVVAHPLAPTLSLDQAGGVPGDGAPSDSLLPTSPQLTGELQHWLIELRRRIGGSRSVAATSPEGPAGTLGRPRPSLAALASPRDDALPTGPRTDAAAGAGRFSPFVIASAGGCRGGEAALWKPPGPGAACQPQSHPQSQPLLSPWREAWDGAWGAARALDASHADRLREAQREVDRLWRVVVAERQRNQNLLGRVSQLERQLRTATRKLSYHEGQERGGIGGEEPSAPPAALRSAENSSLGRYGENGEESGHGGAVQPTLPLHPTSRRADVCGSVADGTATPRAACSFIGKSPSEGCFKHPEHTAFAATKLASAEMAQGLSNLLSRAFRSGGGRDHERDQAKPLRSNETGALFEVQVVPWPDYPSHDNSVLREDTNLSAFAQPQTTNLVHGLPASVAQTWDESLQMFLKKPNETLRPLSPPHRQATVLHN